jgi:hypothetical protein
MFALPIVLVTVIASTSWAVPYASGVSQSGNEVSFILNQDADSVAVILSGAPNLNLGPLSKGAHTFNTGGAVGFEIQVAKSEAAGWTQISEDTLAQSKYYSPKGVTVNRNPTSVNFGRIYVSEGLGGAVAAGGRATTDGLYVMGADQSDILLQGDVAASGGIDWTVGGSNSPFKLSIAPDNSVYLADWSDGHSGLWRAPADVSGVFPNVLANMNRDSAGLTDNHGSIPSVWVEGTGEGVQVYTLDEDFDIGGTTGSVLRYDVGTATDYNGQPVEQTQDGTNIILNLRADVVRDEDGSWWIAQYRSTETPEAPSLTRFLDGGTSPTYNSATDDDLPLLTETYGSLDIQDELDRLALGARSGFGVYILDISDPDSPALLDTVPQDGFTQDVAFDAAGNLYVVSSSTETLKIWSPGGQTVAITGSDGSFRLIPEPDSLVLLLLGGLALRRRRR